MPKAGADGSLATGGWAGTCATKNGAAATASIARTVRTVSQSWTLRPIGEPTRLIAVRPAIASAA